MSVSNSFTSSWISSYIYNSTPEYTIYAHFIDKINDELYYIAVDNLQRTKMCSNFVLLNKNSILVTNSCYDMKLKTFELLYNLE
jgi:hypothetical protein